jgi:MoaA/NifB/PqqE/SkfB family radical SAM enzyme/GT2 family glycosyltransferase
MEINYNITSKCNLSCKMCDIPKMQSAGELDLKQIKKMIDHLKKAGIDRISFTGGEPLIRKDIYEILQYAHKKNIRTFLCSNGTLINEDTVKKIVPYVSSVNISLDGTKNIHEKLRGKGNFDKAVRAIKLLKKHKIHTTIATVITKENYEDIPNLMKFVAGLGVDAIIFQPFAKNFLIKEKSEFEFSQKDIINLRKIINQILELSYKLKLNVNNSPYNLINIPEYLSGRNNMVNNGCSVPQNILSLSADGNLLPCWYIWDSLGNVKNDKLQPMIKSDKLKKFTKLAEDGKCNKCFLACYYPYYKESKLISSFEIGKKRISQINEELVGIRKKYSEIILIEDKVSRNDLVEILRLAKNLGFKKITIRNNGRIFSNMENCKKVSRFVNSFEVYLYGKTSETHDRAVNWKGNHKKAVEAIKNLVSLKQNVAACIPITNYNFTKLYPTVVFANSLGVKKIRFLYSFNDEYYNKQKITPNVSDMVFRIRDVKKYIRRKKMKLLPNNAPFRFDDKFKQSLDIEPILKHNIHKYDSDKKISVIIPTYNRKELLKNTLQSLFNQNFPKDQYEIIVIDDGSTDSTEDMIKSLTPTCDFKYFYWSRLQEFNPGTSQNRAGPARNIGIKNATGNLIVFMDSDIICTPDLLNEHYKLHQTDDNLVVIGYRKDMINPNSETFNDVRDLDYGTCNYNIKNLDAPWRLFYSNNASVKKEHLSTVGMFDNIFVYWGFEDLELGYRLFKLGLKFILNTNALCYHQYHPSECKDFENFIESTKNNASAFYKKYMRIKIYYVYKYFLNYNRKTLNLNGSCNNNCIFCEIFNNKMTPNKSLPQVQEELREIRRNYSEVVISGIEPTLRSDIKNIVNYAKKIGFKKVILRTNGRIFSYYNHAKEITNAGVDKFEIYLFGHNAQTHDKITLCQGSFSQAISGIRNLSKLTDTTVSIVVTNENYKQVKKMFWMLYRLGVSTIRFEIPDMSYSPRKSLYQKYRGMVPNYFLLGKEIKSLRSMLPKHSKVTCDVIKI